MSDSYRLFFGILSLVPGVIAYTYYFIDMFAGKTKPHALSWLIWGLLAGNGFWAQASSGAGFGAWTTGMTSIACLTIFGVSTIKGEMHTTKLDRVSLSLALISFALLFVVDDKVIGLGLTLLATLLGFSMTWRKAYYRPHEETSKAFALNALKFLPAIFALQSFSFLTVAYPLVAGLSNAAVVAIIYARRRALTE